MTDLLMRGLNAYQPRDMPGEKLTEREATIRRHAFIAGMEYASGLTAEDHIAEYKRLTGELDELRLEAAGLSAGCCPRKGGNDWGNPICLRDGSAI